MFLMVLFMFIIALHIGVTKMTPLEQGKKRLSSVYSKEALYGNVIKTCEAVGFEFNAGLSFSKNIRKARSQMMFGVVEFLKSAKKVEAKL